MRALRCVRCGDTRWSLSSFRQRAGTAPPIRTCELCGGQMVEERRKPNHGPLHLIRERRGRAGRAARLLG